MHVTLTPEIEQLIVERMATGRYRSSNDILMAGLRLLAEFDRERQEVIDALNRDIHAGLEQADRGETSPLDMASVQAEGRRILTQRQQAV